MPHMHGMIAGRGDVAACWGPVEGADPFAMSMVG